MKVGSRFPDAGVFVLKGGAPTAQTTGELFAGKKAVLFGVPGAFTPTCSNEHCPMFINLIPKIKAQGAEVVACVSVNDPFVMDAWGKAQNAESVGLQMIADGNGALAEEAGLVLDASAFGLGKRCKRFAVILDDMEVKYLGVDEQGVELSSAAAVLAELKKLYPSE